MSKVLIAGGLGAIGSHLITFLESKGYTVSVLTRNENILDGQKYFYWNIEQNVIDERCFENIEYIIQLAGAGVADKRWTAKRKAEIVNSRVNATQLLFDSIRNTGTGLKAFISASAIGYYGTHTNDHIYSEDDLPGDDFLATTCKEWEKTVDQFETIGIRTVKIRTGIVLMRNNGALSKLITPAKFGLISAMGHGNQYFPWIHIDDLCGIYYKAICDHQIVGAYNAVSPAETTNKQFVQTLIRVFRRPMFLPDIPAGLLKILFGELAITLLYGSRISSAKIKKSGYVFQYDDLNEALKHLIQIKS